MTARPRTFMKRSIIAFCVLFAVLAVLMCHAQKASMVGHDTSAAVDTFDGELKRWSTNCSRSVTLDYAIDSAVQQEGQNSLRLTYRISGDVPHWGYVDKDLGTTRNWKDYDAVSCWSFIPAAARDLVELSIMLYEADGSAYIAQHVRGLKSTGWERTVVPFSKFFPAGEWTSDENDALDRDQIRKLSIGIFQPTKCADTQFVIHVNHIRPVDSNDPSGGGPASQPSDANPRAATNKPLPPNASPVVNILDANRKHWSTNRSPKVKLDYAVDPAVKKEGQASLRLNYRIAGDPPFWGYVDKDLGLTRNWTDYDAISFWSFVPKAARDLVELSIMLYEQDGSAYIAQHARGLKSAGWEQSVIPFSKFFPAGEWTTDENDALDRDQIRKISIGIFHPTKCADKEFTLYVSDIRALDTTPARGPAASPSKPIDRTNDLQKHEPPDGQVYHGVFAFAAPKDWGDNKADWEKQIDFDHLSEYEKLAGKPATVLSFFWFLDWDFPTDMCRKVQQRGKIPHVGVISGAILPSVIVGGKADKKIEQWASAARKYGQPVFVRFLPEMNGNWNRYSEAYAPSETHELYVRAWQKTVKAFRAAGADNVIWVWAPTAIDVGKIHWTDYYPGDDYVDWVGVSVYSFLGTGDPEPQIMDIYNDYAARKPIMIAECGAGDADNDPKTYKPGKRYYDNPEKWMDRFFDTLEHKAPRVKAINWFNIDRERVWRLQESTAKAKSFRNRLSNKRYDATFK